MQDKVNVTDKWVLAGTLPTMPSITSRPESCFCLNLSATHPGRRAGTLKPGGATWPGRLVLTAEMRQPPTPSYAGIPCVAAFGRR
jgi:hypothetical protein